jgi:hypothetical protein
MAIAPVRTPLKVTAVAGAMQPPLTHRSAAAQATPHPPQFAGSPSVSAQKDAAPLPQVVSPGPQLTLQTPAAQTRLPQAFPQVPQLARSFVRSRQLPLQSVRPDGQEGGAQVPPAHTSPAPQAFPQVPQFALSAWVLAQKEVAPLPHFTSGAAQVAEQTPASHDFPAGQTVPQAPQFSWSSCRFTQVPPQGVEPGSAHSLISVLEAPQAASATAASNARIVD